MVERTKIDEAGGDGPANAPEIDGDDERVRLIGEILRDYVNSLGPDRAMTPDAVVIIGERGSGRPAPRSVLMGCGHEHHQA